VPQPSLDPKKLVVLTGAGISAPSGLTTFRDAGGLWQQYRIEDVATPAAWAKNPALVLDFYNRRRAQAAAAQPNAAHHALVSLERHYEVVVITQNVDDLHERAGSTHVVHLHGELAKVRSTVDPFFVKNIGGAPIALGDCCPAGGQLRPDVVWFGEAVQHFENAVEEMRSAGTVIVIGTSLTVFPAAGLLDFARYQARKFLVDLDIPVHPRGFRVLTGSADQLVPALAQSLLVRD
jgi:NAD-dependent deacetylase